MIRNQLPGMSSPVLLPIMLLLSPLLLPFATPVSSQDPPIALSGCPTTCGNISIPYPFSTKAGGCSRDPSFLLTCNHSHNPPKLLWREHEVLDISFLEGEITILLPVSISCYVNGSNNDTMRASPPSTTADPQHEEQGQGHLTGQGALPLPDLTNSPFTYSNRNMFFSTGCATIAFIADGTEENYLASCASFCDNTTTLVNPNDTCSSGIGCCEASMVKGFKSLSIFFHTHYLDTGAWEYNPCSFAFLAEVQTFEFNRTILSMNESLGMTTRVVLDWAMEEKTCKETTNGSTEYASCGVNGKCGRSSDGVGFSCECSPGYHGNPYLPSGCIDIDECKDRNSYPCFGVCTNTPGSYTCSCPEGMRGDPSKLECFDDPKSKVVIGIISGISGSLGFLLLLGGGGLFYGRSKRSRQKQLRVKLFHKNRELLVQQMNASHGDDDSHRTKLFSLKQMKKATDDFDATRVVGRGGHGTVYKGLLSDQRVAAIKKSERGCDDQRAEIEAKEFINEVVILSHVEHRNVVKLLGCCLEAEVPLLVYEFVSNGTLSDHLHTRGPSHLCWDDRLRIATEIASAMAYLHTAASKSIFHRDLKSANILLDEKLTAKVSDFGASKAMMADQTHITTALQGTYGYMDPEYYYTSQLTEKSDVYSMGVILVELMTGERPISVKSQVDNRNRIVAFVEATREGRLFEVVEGVIKDGARREDVGVVAELAESCLRMSGVERPTMKEVEMRLQGLRGGGRKQDGNVSYKRLEEIKGLAVEVSMSGSGPCATPNIFNSDVDSDVGYLLK